MQGTAVHLDPNATLVRRTLAEAAPAFTRLASLRFPDPADYDARADVGGMGYLTSGWFDDPLDHTAEAKRTMGALAAATATREMMVKSVQAAQAEPSDGMGQRLTDYFAHAAAAVKVLDGAIGSQGVSLRPMLTVNTMGTAIPTYEVQRQNGVPSWVVTIIRAPDDPWWTPATCSGCVTNFGVYLLDQPYDAGLVRSPDTTMFGATLAARLATANQNGLRHELAVRPWIPDDVDVDAALDRPTGNVHAGAGESR
jgi:hypothetical protein